ncbi:MAG TPA: glycosyltransferase family 2 protein [Polyangiaceae bacterium]|nr:glycosyltransferase family 2 protein [Polyangiaceae bacterium]
MISTVAYESVGGKVPLPVLAVDPRPSFPAPRELGLYRVELELEGDPNGCAPVLAWDTGRGFNEGQRRAFRRLPSGRFLAECAVDQTWKLWRFDAGAAYDPLLIRSLTLTPIVRRPNLQLAGPWSAIISRAARRLVDHVLRAHTTTDLTLDDAPLPAGFEGADHASGGATRLRLSESVGPGWYMLELRVSFDGVRADTRIYLEGESGDRALLLLPMRSGQLVKRLVLVDAPTVVRLLPLSAPRAFEVLHFRLVRVPERFARSRIERKLSSRHPRYMPRTAHVTPTAMQVSIPGSLDTRSLWAEYNRVFERCGELVSYEEWIEAVERRDCPRLSEQAATIRSWQQRPTFSVVVRAHDSDEAALIGCLNSVLEQTYSQLELCIADDASSVPHVRRILSDYAARDSRVRVVFCHQGSSPADSINAALALGRGEYVCFLGAHDVLAPHALFSLARALHASPEAELVYSDEDKLDELGRRCEPYFKPDFARDLLYGQNYVAHLALYHRKLVEAVEGVRPGFDGSEDYDLLLRCVAKLGYDSKILHVPEVLYHVRKATGASVTSQLGEGVATESARRALSQHLESVSPGAHVSVTSPGLYRAHWPVPTPAPLVSLIVPTRDRHELLAKCVDSIRKHTTYPNYEILIVDNQSQSLEALSYLDALAREQRVRVLRYDAPFNYSAINNFAARAARGDVLGLINNDVDVINGEWLTELVGHALRPDVGCVGAKLYYPDDTIQHAGVVLGIGGVAGHSHKHYDRKHAGYFGRLRIAHNVSAVTAAALVVRRAIWDEVGGLNDAELAVAFNDVDFCLRVMAKGYRNVWTPHAELYHDESRSRGSDEASEKAARFRSECEAMHRRWGPLLERDPYYSPHLTLIREDYSLSLSSAPTPVRGAA